MTIIELITADQKLCTTTEPIVAAGDKKSVKLHVEFSNEWSGYAKAAVFFAGKNIDDIYEVVMTDNECIVPHEVLSEADNLFIGVRGVIASTGAVKTSTLVKYRIEEGAPTGTGTSVEPTADVYQQLLTAHSVMNARLNELVAQNPSGVPTTTELTIEGTSYVTCGSLKVISNGINALIDINNLLWISQTEKTWVTLVTFPESLRPMTTFEEGYADRLLFYFDDNDAAIKLGFRDNKLQMYVANATWAKQQSITCQLPYALKNPILNELSDIRVDANGVTHPTAGEAIRTQFQNIEAEIQEQIDELADEGDNLSRLVLKHEALLTPSQDVMLSDVTMFGNAYIDLQMIEAGHQMTRGHITEQGDANEYADIRFVSKGLQIDISANEYIMGLSRDQLNRYGVVITDTSHVVQRTVFAFEMVENGGIYEMPEDGYAYVYMACGNTSQPVYSVVNGIFGNSGNVDFSEIEEDIDNLQESVDQLFEEKASKAHTYTKEEVDAKIHNASSGGGGIADGSNTYIEYVTVCDGTETCVLVVGEDVQIGDTIVLTKKGNVSIMYSRTDGAFGNVYPPADGTINTFDVVIDLMAKSYTISGCEVSVPKKMYVADLKKEVDQLSEDKADKTEIPTKTSQLENDSGFLTEEEVDAKLENIPSGGGSVPSIGKFIGEVTIDNDETRIVEWTQCADGSPLDFDELFIIAEGMADGSRNICFTTNNEFTSSAYNWSFENPVGFIADTKRYITFHAKLIGNWLNLGYGFNTATYGANVLRHYNTNTKGTQRCTTSLIVGLGWGAFKSGTKIAVWGR